MSWNYRVFRHQQIVRPGKTLEYFTIHEVYYDDSGKIEGHTEEPIAPTGDTLNELITEITQMLKDSQKYDVLEYQDELNE